MKKASLVIITLSLLIFTGCGKNSTPTVQTSTSTDTTTAAETQLITYTSKHFSVQYPKGYTAKENGDMVTISNAKGTIIIGGFIPSNGHPLAGGWDIIFQGITYTKDPKVNADALPVALYYRNGDAQTQADLVNMIRTVKNLP